MIYLLDSGIVGYLAAERLGILERCEAESDAGHLVGTCTPVVGELVSGVERSRSRDRSMAALLQALAQLLIWPFDVEAAFGYGRLSARLHRLGRPMGQIDMQLAAIALGLGDCTVVTTDTDLSRVPGLRVENWAV